MVARSLSLLLLLMALLGGCNSSSDQQVDAAVSGDLGLADVVAPDRALTDRAAAQADGATADVHAVSPDVFLNPVPSLGTVTLLVNLGDSIAAGYGVSSVSTYCALLHQNDDSTYPSLKGKDLATRCAGIQVANKAVSGSASYDLPTQLTRVPANTTGDTVVVVSIGGNDIMYDVLALLDATRMKAIAARVTSNVQKVVDHFGDKTKYTGKTTIALMNVYDFSDAMGTIPANAPTNQNCGMLKLMPEHVAPAVMQAFSAYNAEIKTFTKSKGLLLVDIYAGFLGHGFNYNNTSSKHYQLKDPTLWYQSDCIHPNTRGHHELRRLVWKVLFGE